MSTAIRVVSLALVAAHFGLTVIYVGPLNPLKMRYWRTVNAYVGTYFQQNWSLFAPNPVMTNQRLLVRCLNASELQEAKANRLPISGWFDITSPLVKRHQENRFSAYDRLNRPQSAAIRNFLSGGLGLSPWLEACRKGSPEACRTVDRVLRVSRITAGSTLARIGSSFCHDLGGGRCAGVAMRMRETTAVPWSQRMNGRPTVREFDLGMYPFNAQIASSNIFRMRQQ